MRCGGCPASEEDRGSIFRLPLSDEAAAFHPLPHAVRVPESAAWPYLLPWNQSRCRLARLSAQVPPIFPREPFLPSRQLVPVFGPRPAESASAAADAGQGEVAVGQDAARAGQALAVADLQGRRAPQETCATVPLPHPEFASEPAAVQGARAGSVASERVRIPIARSSCSESTRSHPIPRLRYKG